MIWSGHACTLAEILRILLCHRIHFSSRFVPFPTYVITVVTNSIVYHFSVECIGTVPTRSHELVRMGAGACVTIFKNGETKPGRVSALRGGSHQRDDKTETKSRAVPDPWGTKTKVLKRSVKNRSKQSLRVSDILRKVTFSFVQPLLRLP